MPDLVYHCPIFIDFFFFPKEFFFFNLLIYFGCTGSLLLCGLSLVVVSRGTTLHGSAWASHCVASFAAEHRL